jgi:hypothetical protein
MVVCSVCSSSVLKAQTYHVGGGKRACKSHEGVVERKQEIEASARRKREDDAKAEDERLRRKAEEADPSYAMQPRCWCCKAPSILERDFYVALLVASEKARLKGGLLNPFSDDYPKLLRAELGLKDGESVNVISVFAVENGHPVLDKVNYHMRMAHSVAGCLALCPKCAKSFGLEKPPVKLDLEKAFLMYDLVSPIFKEAAKASLEKEAERN